MSPDRKMLRPGFDHLVFPPDLVRFLLSKQGMRRAFRNLEFLMLWGLLADELGREPTREEFCEEWDESQANYFRRLDAWRGVWPEDKSPQRVWEWHRDRLEQLVEAKSPRLAT